MNRIEVSSSNSGPSNFTFNVNPVIYDGVDEAFVSSLDILHGSNVYQKKVWDDRIRTFRWSGNPVDATYMTPIVNYFRSIEGEIRYFNFRDLDSINTRWDTANAVDDDWKKARVITLRTKARPGGSLIYEYVEVKLQPEQ